MSVAKSAAPMPRFVDLSAPIAPSPPELPDILRTDVEFSDHAEGARTIAAMLGVGPELLRDGEGWAVETFTRLGTHNSTHVDAPYHYNSTIGGAPDGQWPLPAHQRGQALTDRYSITM